MDYQFGVNSALLRFLELAKKGLSHNTIIDKIDDAIIDNKKVQELQKESIMLEIIVNKEFFKKRAQKKNKKY